jgi:Asp-tRNA(Asn)/Glu-tRNA(Gln) amidotransferase A subunit family amidase
MISALPFTLADLARAYAKGVRPVEVVTEAFARLDAANDQGILLHRAEAQALAEAAALGDPDGRPLWGVPFVVKDNIDVAGMPTTAACPDLSYLPEDDPPGTSAGSSALRGAGPGVRTPTSPVANWSRLVLPSTMAPAARRRATTKASSSGR